MPQVKTIAFSMVGICLLSLLVMNVSTFNPKEAESIAQEAISLLKSPSEPSQVQNKYRFTNPRLAYKILTQLDIFTPLNGTYHTFKEVYNKTVLSVTKENDYCEKHRAYITAFPEAIFDEINFVTEYETYGLYRADAARSVGNDIMPYLFYTIPEEAQKEKWTLEPYANSFFTSFDLQNFMQIGKHFSCLSQASNHIPGNKAIARKDYAAKSTKEYAKAFEDRPQCFNFNRFFPKTYILSEKEDCENFFIELNSPRYAALKAENKIVFIGKEGNGPHRGESVTPIFDEDEEELKEIYENGKLCGNETWNYIVQNYIHNVLLLNNHKFDFRMYLLIASSNPLIAYYHDGFLRVTLADYDVESTEENVHKTNLALNSQFYQDAKEGKLYQGMNEEQLMEAQQWTLEQLQTYLLEKKMINNTNWLDDYLRPEFKKAMIHLARMASSYYGKYSSVYELYGVDFILDTNLNLWFLESNVGPSYNGKYTKAVKDLKVEMLKDHLEIVMGLMKSRMKRVVNYVNQLLEEGLAQKGEGADVVIQDLEARRREFNEITQNRFEKEFEPRAGNSFSKIVDENYEGVERYQGFVPLECF